MPATRPSTFFSPTAGHSLSCNGGLGYYRKCLECGPRAIAVLLLVWGIPALITLWQGRVFGSGGDYEFDALQPGDGTTEGGVVTHE